MQKSKHNALLAAGLLALSLGGHAQAQDAGMRTLVPANPKSLYKDPALPHGATILNLKGSPTEEGSFHYRVRMPSGLKMSPHRFAKDQLVTVVKGTYWVGSGDRYNPMKMQEMYAGSVFTIPAGAPTYNWARTEVILHVLTEGTKGEAMAYVNPDDDPRQQ